MLVIRMQRTGRKGHAQFRVVVQDSRRTPLSGKVVSSLGHHNPHSKETKINKERAEFYVEHGAQPTPRVARLLKEAGVKLPKWVKLDKKAEKTTKNPEKLRKNQPKEEAPAKKEVKEPTPPAEETAADEKPAESTDQPAEEKEETPAESEVKEA